MILHDVATNEARQALLLAAAYADVFDYPLTLEELQRYACGVRLSRQAVSDALHEPGLLSRVDNYYTLPGREEIVATRERRERIARRLWNAAAHYGGIIGRLPFVRMVAVTGSLAMNNVEADADIDYLIVTAPSRLWTCRALILTVVRFAERRGVRLCPNYLITTRALSFPEQNLYAARELVQMIPLSGADVHADIRRVNGWVYDFLPNAEGAPPAPVPVNAADAAPGLRSFIEAVMRTPLFDWFERWEMARKLRKLARQQAGSAESQFSADVCKGHANAHGALTVSALMERLKQDIFKSSAKSVDGLP